jgi:cell division transport system permease protein
MITLSAIFKKIKSSVAYYPWMHLSALFVLSATLTIIFSLTLFLKNLESILVSWGSQVEMNIYLADDLKTEDQARIEKSLNDLGHFKSLSYVTKDKAIENFFSKMSRYVPDFAEDKEFLNVIPSSYLATLERSMPISEISNIAKKILKISGIEDVSYGQEWIENFSVFLTTLKNASFAISFVLVLGGLFIIGFISYILINRRREEIEIYELCGATPSMIQAPFVVEGAVLSVLASLIAIVSSYVLLQIQNSYLQGEMMYFGLSQTFEFFSVLNILGLLLSSAAIGAATTFFFIQKLNNGWAAAERV